MSNIDILHSHSGLERILNIPKHIVLVDEEFRDRFNHDTIESFKYNGVAYYKVPTISFVNNGGIFKNFER